MNWWKQWKRNRDGWVERKRRFQTMFGELVTNGIREPVPAAAEATAAGATAKVDDRGKR